MMLGVAWYLNILATLFALVACFLMLVILLQRGRGVGLAGAFGGAGASTAFGAKTGDVLTWATIVIAGLFLIVAVGLNFVFVPSRAGPPAARATPAGVPAQQPPGRSVPEGGTPAEVPPASPQPAGGATPTDSGAAPSAPPAQPAPTPTEPPPTPAQP